MAATCDHLLWGAADLGAAVAALAERTEVHAQAGGQHPGAALKRGGQRSSARAGHRGAESRQGLALGAENASASIFSVEPTPGVPERYAQGSDERSGAAAPVGRQSRLTAGRLKRGGALQAVGKLPV